MMPSYRYIVISDKTKETSIMASYIAKIVKLAKSSGLKTKRDDADPEDEFEMGMIIDTRKLAVMELEDLKIAIKHVLGKEKHEIAVVEDGPDGKANKIGVWLYKGFRL